MADIAKLKAEIDADPLSRGYAAMSDADVAASLMAQDRDKPLASMTGDEVFSFTDTEEFAGRPAELQTMWVSFCGRDSIDPFGVANVDFLEFALGAGPTKTALAAARTIINGQSRAMEQSLGFVGQGDVEDARAL